MRVEPVGLPPVLKAWRQREQEPVVVIRCGAALGCRHEVGAVYRSPGGVVVESWTSEPTEPEADAATAAGLGEFAGGLGIVGLLDDMPRVPSVPLFEDPPGTEPTDAGAAPEPEPVAEPEGPQPTVTAQVDLLHTDFYWHDPAPLCPEHGRLRVDRAALDEAVRSARPYYLAGA